MQVHIGLFGTLTELVKYVMDVVASSIQKQPQIKEGKTMIEWTCVSNANCARKCHADKNQSDVAIN